MKKVAGKPRAKAKAVAISDSPQLIAHDAAGVTVGGFATFLIAGTHRDSAIVTCSFLEVSAAVALVQPPSIRMLASEFIQGCATSRDGSFVALLGLKQKDRYVRVFPPSLDARAATDLVLKKRVEFASVGFSGDRVVAIPGHLGVLRRASVIHAEQPYLQVGERLVPATGVTPADRGDAHELSGVVACDDGRDLIVWAGRLYELQGDALVRVAAYDLQRNHNNEGLSAVATGGAGFFTISNQRLVEVVPGEAAPRMHVPDKTFRWVRRGPRTSLLLEAAHETATTSALWLYDPARQSATPINAPPGTYPLTAFYSSARDAIGVVASANEGTKGYRIVLAPVSAN